MNPFAESDALSLVMRATWQVRETLLRGSEESFAALRQFDALRRWREIGVFVALWLSGIALARTGWNDATGWRQAVLVASGVLLSALALNAFVLLMHEGLHNLLFANPVGNYLASVALGGTFLVSFTAYRVLHTRHHHFLSEAGDPDNYRNYTRNARLLWALHFVRLTLGCPIYLVMIPVLAWRYGTPRERRRIGAELCGLALAWVGIFTWFSFSTLLAAWLLPLLVVSWLVPMRAFAQHSLTVPHDPLTASRTITSHPVVAFLLLNENYHLEHHLFPEVPSYHLPALHRLIWPRLPHAVAGNSYLGFIARFLRAAWRHDESPIGLQRRSTPAVQIADAA